MSTFLFVTPTWDGQLWAAEMRKAMPDMDVRLWPEMGDPAAVDYVAAWLPPPNVLRSLTRLKVIFSLGAGVDAILKDPTLPVGIPIVRVNDPDLTMRMSEYIVLHVLLHHRQQRRLDANQRSKVWDSFPTHAASALRVGIMGLGVLGQDAARKLAMMGFKVAGWSRSPKSIEGVQCFAGAGGLDTFLARTDILVSLLPATADTDGILNRSLFSRLSRKGPFGAPILINAGRGRQQVEDDIVAALDSGALHAATLDVFNTEPLPADHPLWSHPKVTLTPHAAADSEPSVICGYVARQISEFEATGVLHNLVDRQRGY
ncbi:MAG: glyoxylate/hydroxypyruvate reductase A [Phyllobacteriaceae bacterium]|nr:glyoxylate/hydroxypyruvate reductase A [Phyllobacteriaceae bacterium]